MFCCIAVSELLVKGTWNIKIHLAKKVALLYKSHLSVLKQNQTLK